MIGLHNVAIGYKGKTLIKDATCSFDSGKLTALLGRNGSGKSTLLRVLSGLSKPQSGIIKCCGKDINAMTTKERASSISFVNTQRISTTRLSCFDIVGFGRAPYTDWSGRLSHNDRAIVEQMLDLVGMQDYADRQIETLSDGEYQRVMIARALAQATPVILLDEPTSFLDLPSRYQLCTLLKTLAHDHRKCIIFSTHELSLALKLCDDIALIDTPTLRLDNTEHIVRDKHIERLFEMPDLTQLY